MESEGSLTDLIANTDLLENPRVVGALEGFVVEAIEEATDLLRHGDMATRTQLIRLILSMALRSKDQTPTNDAEEILEKARHVVTGILND